MSSFRKGVKQMPWSRIEEWKEDIYGLWIGLFSKNIIGKEVIQKDLVFTQVRRGVTQIEDASKRENIWWKNGPGCRTQSPGTGLERSCYIFFQTNREEVRKGRNINKLGTKQRRKLRTLLPNENGNSYSWGSTVSWLLWTCHAIEFSQQILEVIFS